MMVSHKFVRPRGVTTRTERDCNKGGRVMEDEDDKATAL